MHPASAALLVSLLLPQLVAGDEAKYPLLDNSLSDGRDVWINNCEGCHAYGFAGSPNPKKPADWQPRLKQETSVLYRHAIEGFFGPGDTYMPPRGGNDSLTDEQVRGAVDYMRALAQHYIEIEGNK